MGEGIVIKNCTKIYRGVSENVLAVANISFEIPRGEIYCLMGPSGSGKTTLLNMISGLVTPDTGEINVLGINLNILDKFEKLKFRLEKIGYIFQDFKLIEFLNVWENIALPILSMGLEENEVNRRVKKISIKLGLNELLEKYPNELSFGERQRVAIARELVKDPPIILADEPTSNLDIDLKIRVLELFKEFNKEKRSTILIASHDPIVLNYCSKAIYIESGTLTGIHSTETLEKDRRLMEKHEFIRKVNELRRKLISNKISEEEFIREYIELKSKFLK